MYWCDFDYLPTNVNIMENILEVINNFLMNDICHQDTN